MPPPPPPSPLPLELIIAATIIAATTIAFVLSRAFSKRIGVAPPQWKAASELIGAFGNGLGLKLDGLMHPLALGAYLLQTCQQRDDARVVAASSSADIGAKLHDGANFIKYAAAATEPAESDETWFRLISALAGCGPSEFIRLHSEKRNDDDDEGDSHVHVPRHFVVVDESHRAIVLALGGTSSVEEASQAAAAGGHEDGAPFCGGRAHARTARMAEAVWRAVGDDVNAALEGRPTFELVVTGHSIGAGTAGLVTILLYYLRASTGVHRTGFLPPMPPPPRSDVPIRCLAYAPPPVFAPPGRWYIDLKGGALAHTYTYVLADDAVPFLSARAGRLLFASLRALDAAFDARSSADQQIEALTAAATASAASVPASTSAPELTMPGRRFVWLRHAAPESGLAPRVVECDVTVVTTSVLGGVPLASSMIDDHDVSAYAAALIAAAAAHPAPIPAQSPEAQPVALGTPPTSPAPTPTKAPAPDSIGTPPMSPAPMPPAAAPAAPMPKLPAASPATLAAKLSVPIAYSRTTPHKGTPNEQVAEWAGVWSL